MSDWIKYVKKYAAANGVSYGVALREAGPSYYKSKKDDKTKKYIDEESSDEDSTSYEEKTLKGKDSSCESTSECDDSYFSDSNENSDY